MGWKEVCSDIEIITPLAEINNAWFTLLRSVFSPSLLHNNGQRLLCSILHPQPVKMCYKNIPFCNIWGGNSLIRFLAEELKFSDHVSMLMLSSVMGRKGLLNREGFCQHYRKTFMLFFYDTVGIVLGTTSCVHLGYLWSCRIIYCRLYLDPFFFVIFREYLTSLCFCVVSSVLTFVLGKVKERQKADLNETLLHWGLARSRSFP